MDTHKSAPLTPKGREMMVGGVIECGLSKAEAARRFNTTPKTVAKWMSGSRPRALKACATAPQGRFPRRAKRRRPSARRSRLCAGGVTPASRSPPKSGYRRPRSAASSNGSASTACRRSSRPSRCAATNATIQARSSTSTSRSSASSIASVTGSRRPHRSEQHSGSGLGICASGDRRPFAGRLLGNPAR